MNDTASWVQPKMGSFGSPFSWRLRYDEPMKDYQATMATPFGVLGIHCDQHALTGIEFLAPDVVLQSPVGAVAREVCGQLAAYFVTPAFRFELPLRLAGTAHQTRVWQLMRAIRSGQTRCYGDLAEQLSSSPHAVGQACGANPIPIVIPCHRVVSRAGLGGFMHQRAGFALDCKRWLLAHEQR